VPAKHTYITVDFFCIIFPFLFSFHPKINFFKQWKYFFLPCIIIATLFIAWDILFTHWGVWRFNPSYILGVYFLNLPIEEIFFFVCVPYACVFTYYSITLFFNFYFLNKIAFNFSWILVVTLLVVALFNLQKLYTSVTFILLAILLIILYLKRVNYLSPFFVSFIIILIPFFISNGILTGSFIKEPVVIYNNDYNLNIRLFTIPLEDTFYGMLLLLMNISGFEFLKTRNS
jgi:lycopene cyclase domain-containing protein